MRRVVHLAAATMVAVSWRLITAVVLCLSVAPAHALTWAEVVACKPEAVRLCDAGPADLLDYSRVAACMRQKWPLVSKACRDAVAATPK